jgi:hypothetical protein
MLTSTKLTIELALSLRAELKLNKANQVENKYSYGERSVFSNILAGYYDNLKDVEIVSQEDIDFLNEEK